MVHAGEFGGHRDRYGAVPDSTTGIIFLGVPHSGAKMITIAKIVCRLNWMVGARTDLLHLMGEDSKQAAVLHDRFMAAYRTAVKKICFYECVDTKFLGISIGPVCSRCALEKSTILIKVAAAILGCQRGIRVHSRIP